MTGAIGKRAGYANGGRRPKKFIPGEFDLVGKIVTPTKLCDLVLIIRMQSIFRELI
jgi:hypothetical protein